MRDELNEKRVDCTSIPGMLPAAAHMINVSGVKLLPPYCFIEEALPECVRGKHLSFVVSPDSLHWV